MPLPTQEPEIKSDEEEEEKKEKSASLFETILSMSKGEKKKKDIPTKKMAKGKNFVFLIFERKYYRCVINHMES